MTKPRPTLASRKLYDSIQSGQLPFEEFEKSIVPEGLAIALERVHLLISSASLTEVKCVFTSKTWTTVGDVFHFEILKQTQYYWTHLAHVSFFNGKFKLRDEPWMSLKKATTRLKGQG